MLESNNVACQIAVTILLHHVLLCTAAFCLLSLPDRSCVYRYPIRGMLPVLAWHRTCPGGTDAIEQPRRLIPRLLQNAPSSSGDCHCVQSRLYQALVDGCPTKAPADQARSSYSRLLE